MKISINVINIVSLFYFFILFVGLTSVNAYSHSQVYIVRDLVQDIPSYNNASWRIFIFNISYSSHDIFYLNSYVYDWGPNASFKDIVRDPVSRELKRFLRKINNYQIPIYSKDNKIALKKLMSEIKDLLRNYGIYVNDIRLGLDLLIIRVFKGSLIENLDDIVIDKIFNIYIKYSDLRKELAIRWADYLCKEIQGCKYYDIMPVAFDIINMSIDEIRDRFKIIVVEMLVTEDEYYRYFNETVNKLYNLLGNGTSSCCVFTGGDESLLGAVMVDMAINKLQERGLDIKDAIRCLRKAIGSYYPLHINVYFNNMVYLPLPREHGSTRPIIYLFIPLALISILAIYVGLHSRRNRKIREKYFIR